MTYRGFSARIEYDADDRILVGRLAGISDIVCFHGDDADQLEAAFRESVDGYIAACEQLGQPPQKPASGKMLLRVPPETHANALRAAQLAGKSLNQWAAEIIKQAADA